MKDRRRAPALCGILFLLGGAVGAAENGGRVEGRVTKKGTDAGIGAVTVLVNELKLAVDTDAQGRFKFDKIAPGTYNVVLTLGNETAVLPMVVEAGGTTTVAFEVDWEARVYEELTVIAEALATKVVDAPAAVTSIPEEQIEQVASTGQVPKVLEFTPGAEVTQSGLYDFNFNTRGFNSSLNRRVSTYIDGRDVGVVLLGAQEWAAISGGLDDVAHLDFVRGPSAALYGANASSGVVNITTKAPRDSLGGLLRFTGGELDTQSVDFRQGFKISDQWFGKVLAGFKNSGDFSISRDPDVVVFPEYSEFCLLVGETDCLPGERTLKREQDNEIRFGALRFDRYLGGDSLLTFEAGMSTIKGPVFQTGIGRVQNLDSERPFYRVNWSNPNWNVLAHYSSREGNQENLVDALVVGYELITDDERYGVEFQGNWKLGGDRGRLVVGGAATWENVDTRNPATGRQTVVWEPVSSNRQAIFSQFDWSPNRHLKFVAAGRVDRSTLHETQFSPKAAMVWNINGENSMRLTYNRAFQVANYSELFLHTPIASFPIGGFVRVICGAPFLPDPPVDCGIEGDFIPVLAVGNDDLALEHTEAWELGYSGLLAHRFLVTVDYYRSKNTDFITDLVQQVGTILGDTEGCVDHTLTPSTDPKACPINNDYKPWISTEEAESTIFFGTLTVAQALRNAVNNSVGGNTLGFRLAQDLDGSTVIVGRTYTNVGQVDTQGIDLGIQYFITKGLSLQASYSWFDFEIVDPSTSNPDEQAEIDAILLPNSPEHKASIALTVQRKRWDLSFGARWVQGFRWSAGVFQGDVPEYATVDVGGSFAINDRFRLGANVANARDNLHRQTFGGDLLYRRALLYLTMTW